MVVYGTNKFNNIFLNILYNIYSETLYRRMDNISNQNDNSFDILNYLNDMYMMKIAPQLDVKHAGGYYNIHQDNNNVDKEILEINKKRINIPNAEIKRFSYRQQDDIKEYNEPETESTGDISTGEDGKGDNDLFTQGEQERSFGSSITKEIIEI